MAVTAEARFRAHARRKVRLRVLIRHVRAGWEDDAEAQDVGLGGACLRVARPYAVEDPLLLSFVAPTLWDPLVLPGRVAWVAPPTHVESARAGIAFQPKDPKAVLAFFELLGALGYDE